ncbi:MAG: peptide chain release factor N(5)-glutamine methyltransferase [Thiomonas sp.]|uniref:peptide chain release factor N(5)-glutamine methyltransferase n=1 Tax=Thiomonas sp. TaxID=2047785 RepID=UPI002A35D9C5|nr:peptide chain release factor N(5)-glutamine methyltransferase [Thiomonas sp.]MDY0329387.1 peptide chain release factor N(5)-glutamine methyltransferase [Thiomonas sp.]
MAAPCDLAAWTRTCGLARLDAQALIQSVLGWTRAQQAAHPERELGAADLAQLNALAVRLREGEPLAYVLGEREFFGLSFKVTPNVLIPRPDTELLVELALRHLDALPAGRLPAVLDMGTGSGAIAIAIAHARPQAQVWALDASTAALAVAQCNAQRLLDPQRPGGALRLLQSNWWDALRPLTGVAHFDCIVSNPPYIAVDDPHLPALRHEPSLALTGRQPNADGMDDLRQIIAQADRFLRDDGCLLLEHGYDQAAVVRDLLTMHHYQDVFSARDLAGIERASGGILPGLRSRRAASKMP